MSVLIDVYKVWPPQPAAQVEPAATPSRPIAPVENSPTALLIRRIAEALAQDAIPPPTARLPSLTPLRPTLSESTVRVAPMSESVTMQNNGDRELAALARAIAEMPKAGRTESRKAFVAMRDGMERLAPMGSSACPQAVTAMHAAFADAADPDAAILLKVRCGLCPAVCGGNSA